MPLIGSDSVLSAAIKAQILARPAINAVDGDALDDLCDAIAAAVVTHITANAVLAVTGVTPGGGAATGTIV